MVCVRTTCASAEMAILELPVRSVGVPISTNVMVVVSARIINAFALQSLVEKRVR